MVAWLNCDFGRGQFSSEYGIQARTADHSLFSLFAPVEMVRSQSPYQSDGIRPGQLRVSVVSKVGTQALVQLPAESFEAGYFVTVDAAELQEERVQQEA